MAWLIAAVLGTIGFLAVLVLGLVYGVDLAQTLLRAAVAFGVGGLLGGLLIGPLGVKLMKEAAGSIPAERPSVPEEEEKPEQEQEEEKKKGEEPESEQEKEEGKEAPSPAEENPPPGPAAS